MLLGHRFYDPSVGRFLTRDPIKDGRNWYGYCENEPVAYADEGGLQRSRLVRGLVDWVKDLFRPRPRPAPRTKPKPGLPPRLVREIEDKLPPEVRGKGVPNQKKEGMRWELPGKRSQNGVRVDKGDPTSGWPSQRVDHVVIIRNGRRIDRDGKDVVGDPMRHPERWHIPLKEWLKWPKWNSPH